MIASRLKVEASDWHSGHSFNRKIGGYGPRCPKTTSWDPSVWWMWQRCSAVLPSSLDVQIKKSRKYVDLFIIQSHVRIKEANCSTNVKFSILNAIKSKQVFHQCSFQFVIDRHLSCNLFFFIWELFFYFHYQYRSTGTPGRDECPVPPPAGTQCEHDGRSQGHICTALLHVVVSKSCLLADVSEFLYIHTF